MTTKEETVNINPEIKVVRDRYLSLPKTARKEKAAAHKKWSELSLDEVDRATNIEEAKAAFFAAPWGTPAKVYALEKWVQFCTNFTELMLGAYFASHRRITNNPALRRYEELFGVKWVPTKRASK